MKKLTGFLVGLGTIAGLSVTSALASTLPATYTVKSGDSLWKISQHYQVSIQNLVAWNHLQGTMIYPNQTLKLQSPATSAASANTTYTVQSGDTLWKIAQAHHVTVQNLVSWNHIQNAAMIYVGEKLALTGGSAQTGSNAVSGQALVNYAETFLGVPYKWGGESSSGFDCSGLVQKVFTHFGVSVPRTANEQAHVGKVITKSQLKAGDLVFFNTTGKPYSHVGIYTGNGQFVSATDHGVRISSMTNPYWAPRFTRATNPQG